MTIISARLGTACDPYSRLVDQLRLELGSGDIRAIADCILEAERADFHWEARVEQRYLGQHLPLEYCADDGSDDLARIAILSSVRGFWHAGICLVDGDGCPVDLLWLRSFARRQEAADLFERAR